MCVAGVEVIKLHFRLGRVGCVGGGGWKDLQLIFLSKGGGRSSVNLIKNVSTTRCFFLGI